MKSNKSTSTEIVAASTEVIAESNENKGTILFTEAGKKATVTAYRPEGSREVNVVLKPRNKKSNALHIAAELVDVRSMKAENLQDACRKAAHGTGNLALFTLTVYRGKRGMIRSLLNESTGNGYATLIRKGAKPFSFPLNRVDLIAMKAETIADAFDKAVWATGSIAVIKYDDAQSPAESAPVAAPAQS